MPVQDYLRHRYPGKDPPATTEVEDLFERKIQPLLASLGAPSELVETYTVARRCEAVETGRHRFVVFDHAMLEAFALLERLRAVSDPSFIAAALQRTFAEAARHAGHVELYRFFVDRALEIAPIVAPVHRLGDISADMRSWQVLLILLHEAAHGLLRDDAFRDRVTPRARRMAAAVRDEQVSRLVGRGIDGALDSPHHAAWRAYRRDHDVSDEAISQVFDGVATNPRFLEEVACDSFAILQLQAFIHERSRGPDGDRHMIPAFASVYRGFLHLRLLGYIDEVARRLDEHRDQETLNPLKLEMFVEVGFRSNLIVQQLLDLAEELAGVSFAARLRPVLAEELDQHAETLFYATNELLERTLLSSEFHDDELPRLLAANRVDVQQLRAQPAVAMRETDALWSRLVE